MLVRLITAVFLLLCSQIIVLPQASAQATIAVVGPLSGAYAAYGTQLLSGASQAIQDINHHGGVNGQPLTMVPFDDLCDPEHAATLAAQLAQDKQIIAVLGHTCSAATLAANPLYGKAQKLAITPSATHPDITNQGLQTVFRLCGRDDTQGTTIAEFIANKLKSQRVAILHDHSLYALSLSDRVGEHLATLEQTPALYHGIQPGTEQFTELINKFKELSIDSVFFAGHYPEIALLAQAMVTSKLQIPLIAGDSIALQAFAKHPGDLAYVNGTLMSFNADPNVRPEVIPILKTMLKNQLEIQGYTLYGYAGIQVIATAMTNTSAHNGPALSHWLHHNTVNTVIGSKSWDTNGDIIGAEYKIYIWNHNGQFRLVN